MIDQAIIDFLNERKEKWLTAKLKTDMAEEKKLEKELEADEKFSLENWLPDAFKRAGQLTLSTHVCKFSHGFARTSGVIVEDDFQEPGFLYSTKANSEIDVWGNAAAFDVYTFLSITLKDHKSVLTHLEEESAYIKAQFDIRTSSFQELYSDFIKIKDKGEAEKTSAKVKQVYFPTKTGYHLLSTMVSSGNVFKMKEKIDAIRFSETTKEAKKAKFEGSFHDDGYDELLNLTEMGYGGTKPQVISYINNKNGGKVSLLSSLPPFLNTDNIRIPKRNFFGEFFTYYHCKRVMYSFHKLLKIDWKNNLEIRNARDRYIEEFIDLIVQRMWLLRSLERSTIRDDQIQNLPAYQKKWLFESATENDLWLSPLCFDVALKFIQYYEKILQKNAVKMGDTEKQFIFNVVDQNKEAFKW